MGSGITSFPSAAAVLLFFMKYCCWMPVYLYRLLELIRIGNVRSWTAGIAQLLSAEWKVDFEGVYYVTLCGSAATVGWVCNRGIFER